MQLRQLFIASFCLLCLVACTKGDAYQARYDAGQKALQKQNKPLALASFQQAADIAQLELNDAGAAGQKRKTFLMNRVADAKSAVAKIRLDAGDLIGARQIMLEVLALREQLHGRNDESVATILSALATVAYEQEKYAQAEEYALEAYEIRLKALGDKHAHVAIAANNLAEVYQKQGKDVEAEKMFEQSIKIYERSDNQPGVLDVLNNLAMFYKKQGRLSEARHIIEMALSLEKQESDPSVVDRAMTLNALGAVDKAMYEYELADKHYKEAIELLDKAKQNEETAAALCDALDNYGDFLLMQSDYKNAEPVYQRAITMCERSRGVNHSSTAERLSDLGILYKNTGRMAEAEANLKRALDIQLLGFEVDSPTVLQTLYKLSAVYKAEKQYEKACDMFESILPKLEKRYGSSHPYVADVLENWASAVSEDPPHAAQAAQLQARAKKIRGSGTARTRPAERENNTRHSAPTAPIEEES